MTDKHVNVGTPGHIDHGSNLITDPTAHPHYCREDYAAAYYSSNEWMAKPEPTSKELSDKRNSADKRNKKKTKAQKKARRINRR